MINNTTLYLRWYGTLPYCDVLPTEINDKIKHNLKKKIFLKIVTLQRSAMIKAFTKS